MGVSVESKSYAFRINHLHSVPAGIRLISVEPLLGPLPDLDLSSIHWLIAGGESGHNARPMEEEWVLPRSSQRCRQKQRAGFSSFEKSRRE